MGYRVLGMHRFGAGVLLALPACRDVATAGPSAYAEARAIVGRHCVSCHSEHPTVAAFPIAPSGVLLDTPARMQRYAERIQVRAVIDRSMPLLNKTGMTDGERDALGRWVKEGATLP